LPSVSPLCPPATTTNLHYSSCPRLLWVTSDRDGWASLQARKSQHLQKHLSASSWHPGLSWIDGGALSRRLMSTEQALAEAARLIISKQRIYSDFGLTLPRPAQLLFIKDPHSPGRPWQIVCPRERSVRLEESQTGWAAPAQKRNEGGV
jgi:hypothetical protein